MIPRILTSFLAAAGLLACSVSSAPAAEAPKKNLDWVQIDENNGIWTACATDGIRLFRKANNGAITAAPDHTCDK